MKSNIFSQRLAKHFSQLLALLIVPLLFASCNDFLDITPTGRVIAKTGEEYRQLLTYEYKYFPSDRAITTVRSDEMTMMPGFTSDLDYATYFDLWRWNDESPSTSTTYFGWRRYYHAIYIANYIIEHQADITDATANALTAIFCLPTCMHSLTHKSILTLRVAYHCSLKPTLTPCLRAVA